ncbi:NAD-dependent epimerase/dehydratase family protein [Mariniflexile sp. HNIBRBA6329]|uniref:NAD-dependent epimerase/dehydratase family protein n=1 Tax=Mariniflexile sp. HNIBRBA6329 TaxID=3373088 RepID=UPI0037472D7D
MKKSDIVSKSTVLVTGANGLLGVNTIMELLSQGYSVKGLLRDKKKFPAFEHENLELIEGDIMDYKCLCSSMGNIKYVVHIAATTSQSVLNYEDYRKVNFEGTKNTIEAAIINNVQRFIYVSTASAIGFGSLDNLGSESHKIRDPFDKSFYAISKLEAQEYIAKQKHRIEVVTVNPTFLIGAYDSKPTSGKIVLMGLRKRLVFCPPGGRNFVGVKDVSKGIIKALEKGKNGQLYLLANENLTFKQFFQLLRTITNGKYLILELPKPVLLTIGYFGNMLRWLKIRTSLSMENMKAICSNNYYSNNKAKTELRIAFNPIGEAINEAVKWFVKYNRN